MMNTINSRLFAQNTPSVMLIGGLLMSGCSITMQHDDLAPSSRNFTDPIGIDRRSEGVLDGSRVGWGRFTVFAIPIVPIYINGEDNELVMEQIKDALEHVGYQASFTDSETTTNGPKLKCTVNEFSFSNYTWLFPIVPTWGDIKLTMDLMSPSGHVLWSREFEGDGSTLNFFDGYTIAANESMTEILDEMVEAFSGGDFRVALAQAH